MTTAMLKIAFIETICKSIGFSLCNDLFLYWHRQFLRVVCAVKHCLVYKRLKLYNSLVQCVVTTFVKVFDAFLLAFLIT